MPLKAKEPLANILSAIIQFVTQTSVPGEYIFSAMLCGVGLWALVGLRTERLFEPLPDEISAVSDLSQALHFEVFVAFYENSLLNLFVSVKSQLPFDRLIVFKLYK